MGGSKVGKFSHSRRVMSKLFITLLSVTFYKTGSVHISGHVVNNMIATTAS